MRYRIFCLYASLKGEEPGPWLIAAEDEYAWEGAPERCEGVFAAARELAERNDWDVREISILVPMDAVYTAFESPEIAATVE
jgi:hypothetical protein